MPYIPREVVDQCLADPFYKKCCLCGLGTVQLHENLIFAGQQVKEKECILPLCPFCHLKADRKDIREKLDWRMYNRMTDDQLEMYSKAIDLKSRKFYLNQKYGTFAAKV